MSCEVWSYQLPAPIPSKKNSRRNFAVRSKKTGKTRFVSLPNDAYNEWERRAIVAMMAAGLPPKPLSGVSVALVLQFKDKRVRDTDNAMSSVLDALKKGGVIADDRWLCVPMTTTSASLAADGIARAEVTIRAIE